MREQVEADQFNERRWCENVRRTPPPTDQYRYYSRMWKQPDIQFAAPAKC